MGNSSTVNFFFIASVISYLLLSHGHLAKAVTTVGGKEQWQLLLKNTGVIAMHMALSHDNTVIMFDQTDKGPTRYKISSKECTNSSCYAHSVEYNIRSNTIRPLHINSNTWYSSGSLNSNGTLVQTGGFGLGSRRIHHFEPCVEGHCDWKQGSKLLSAHRWYASNLRLPENDRIIVVGGRGVFSYEFVPKRAPQETSFELPFLHRTLDKNGEENNLYPFVHLSSDGNLFIFANRDSILFNYKRNLVVKSFPRIPGRGSRSYPSSGSSVILPLHHKDGFKKVEVLICGGSAPGAFSAAQHGIYLQGTSTCGRMVITGPIHMWKMERMPGPRLMNDMIIIPNGDILIINGAQNGSAGSNCASNPSYNPYLYKPKKPLGKRFQVLKATKIARLHHSSALLLPDGRVLIAGSNPNNNYTLRNVPHPTELRLQAFIPGHMNKAFGDRRPQNVSIYTTTNEVSAGYGKEFTVKFLLEKKELHHLKEQVSFTAYAPPFTTHSISMNQRLLVLKCNNIVRSEDGAITALVEAPPSQKVAPSGFYMLSVVNNGIPSTSVWIKFTEK